MLPVPFNLAQQTGVERSEIGQLLQEGKSVEQVAQERAAKLKISSATLLETVREIDEHLKEGAPLPTESRIVLEAYDRYVVVHACFGETVNRTLGGVLTRPIRAGVGDGLVGRRLPSCWNYPQISRKN
jgi:Lhr-like helicase